MNMKGYLLSVQDLSNNDIETYLKVGKFMSVKIDIISGFLGAGKTTMIKKLLKEGVLDNKVALIENEFGDINIDSERLGNFRSNIEIKSITSGCICCTLAGEFDLAIRELIAKYNPDRIIIEPTGVGRLSDILATINLIKKYEDIKLNIIMTIVDVCEFEDFIDIFGGFFIDQIKNANTVVISKSQLTDDFKVNRVIDSVREMNNDGNIIATSWDKLGADYILEIAESGKKTKADNKINPHCEGYNHKDDLIKEEFEFYSFETMKKYNRTKLKELLNKLNKDVYGEIFRSKGIVLDDKDEWINFDFTPGKTGVVKGNTNIIGKIIVIGKKLNKDTIKNLFS